MDSWEEEEKNKRKPIFMPFRDWKTAKNVSSGIFTLTFMSSKKLFYRNCKNVFKFNKNDYCLNFLLLRIFMSEPSMHYTMGIKTKTKKKIFFLSFFSCEFYKITFASVIHTEPETAWRKWRIISAIIQCQPFLFSSFSSSYFWKEFFY